MIERPRLRHHIAGIAAGALLFSSFAIGLQLFRSAAEGVQPDPVHFSYRAFNGDDFVGLARVGVAKAMRERSDVKLVWAKSDICGQLEDFAETAFTRVQMAASYDAKALGVLRATKPTSITAACLSDSLSDLVVTSSTKVRAEMNDKGVRPAYVGLAN